MPHSNLAQLIPFTVFLFWFLAGSLCSAFDSDIISVESRGSGQDLILIHGFASSPEVWKELEKDFAPSFRTHLVSIRGFAGSKPPQTKPESYLAALQDEIRRYISEGNLKRPVLLGHSMGGLVSLLVAAKNPEMISKVIVLDALPFYQLLQGPSAKPPNKKMLERIAKLNQSQFAMFLAGGVSTLTKTPGKTALLIEWGSKSDRNLYLKYFEEIATYDARPQLSQILCPVIVFYASDPTMRVTEEQLKTLYSTAYSGTADIQLESISNSLHFMMWDQPEVLRAKIREALEEK